MQSNTTSHKPDASILIRTKNEDKFIGKTLSVLFSQTYKNFEVLIVDSGSTDNTLEVVQRYPVKIHEIRPEEFTWGYALNYGFRKAKGEYVVCLSAHALPLSDRWLETLIANFDDGQVAAVASRILPCPDCNPFDRRGLFKKYNLKKQELFEGPPFIFSNAASVIRKSVWEKIHFDESLLAVEEEDWARKVRRINFKIMYEPGAKVYHSHNESLRQIYKRHYELSHAFKLLEFQEFSTIGILCDLFAGSFYDMLYVILKRDNLKWFFVAPLRRFAINYARYKAYRAADKNRMHKVG
ncbi:MAG TPA: glycosyltransferase [Nitrospirae bacterium]|nr:poly-beta-1,6-N-acetyl-D-glucosamine synthase [bacterium BMS3Abin06]HDH12734.1 glycosyltransferase [Nitrospirota bacterium]HDZ00043.1 glycosyltransferase [Nitrospirota bacterium]